MRTPRRVMLTGLALVVLAIGCGACRKPVQEPGTVVVEADSITWQYTMTGAETQDFPGAQFHAGPGWQMDGCKTGVTPVCDTPLQNVRNQVDAQRADTVVYALGTNDANRVWNGGWTSADADRWAAGLTAPPADSCVVVILPWVAPHAADGFDMDEARGWILEHAATLPNVVTVDWAPYAQQPGVLAADGIHLAYDVAPEAPTATAVEARRQVIADGIAACGR